MMAKSPTRAKFTELAQEQWTICQTKNIFPNLEKANASQALVPRKPTNAERRERFVEMAKQVGAPPIRMLSSARSKS